MTWWGSLVRVQSRLPNGWPSKLLIFNVLLGFFAFGVASRWCFFLGEYEKSMKKSLKHAHIAINADKRGVSASQESDATGTSPSPSSLGEHASACFGPDFVPGFFLMRLAVPFASQCFASVSQLPRRRQSPTSLRRAAAPALSSYAVMPCALPACATWRAGVAPRTRHHRFTRFEAL